MQTEMRRQVLADRWRAVALGGVVATGEEGHPRLAGDMGLRLGHLAGDEGIGAGSDRRLEIALGTPGAPGQAAQRPAVARQQQRGSAQRHAHAGHQDLRVDKACRGTDEAQILLAETAIGQQPEPQAELGVVAEFGTIAASKRAAVAALACAVCSVWAFLKS